MAIRYKSLSKIITVITKVIYINNFHGNGICRELAYKM